MSANLLAIFYLISGVLFILALRGLSSPETSRQGNLYGIMGMVIAIGVTIISVGNFSTGFLYLIIFLLAGGSIGAELCRVLSDLKPYKLVLFENSEPSLYAIYQELIGNNFNNIQYVPLLGSVTNSQLVDKVIKKLAKLIDADY